MKSINQRILEGNQLLLRAFEYSDAKRVQELAGNQLIADTTEAIPHPYEDGMAESWISSHKDKLIALESISYAIILKKTNEFIGAVGLTLNMSNYLGEIGYWVGHPYWGNGFATEALIELLVFAKQDLNLNKVMGRHLTRNIASGKVMKKNNFLHKCRLEKHVLKHGVFEDVELWEKLL